MRTRWALAAGVIGALALPAQGESMPARPVLQAEKFQRYIEQFNGTDEELYAQAIPNSNAWNFLQANIPLFECPDPELEQVYYFRWWTFRKHIKQTPDGYVITEFLPHVGWSGKHNTINCAAGHHLYEGRWLRDPRYLDDYSYFWFRKGGDPRRYSFWAADALWARHLANGDPRVVKDLLPDLCRNWEAWVKDHRDACGLFWQEDGCDGMEVSIGGSGVRVTINSYQYGDAVAIARIADLAGQAELAATYRGRAAQVRQRVEALLWDAEAQFFKVLPRGEGRRLVDVREEHGFTPWYFSLPSPDKSAAWKQLMDPQGFRAPFGPTTAEQRHPRFAVAYEGHECQWNGPSWPYATAVTLTALANLLNGYTQEVVTAADYVETLKTYARSHRLQREDGSVVPWIDENLNPATGDWIARTLLRQRHQAPRERGKDYNHSSFCDLVITGLVGLRPRADDVVEVNPLAAPLSWPYFCLDRVPYHGRMLSIVWDRSGERYGLGRGLRVLADGEVIASSAALGRVSGRMAAP